MTPLVTLLVIGLLLVVVAVLLVWALVSPGKGLARAERATGRPNHAEARAVRADTMSREAKGTSASARTRAKARSNDDLRGAKAARPEPKESVPDDAFERFLRAGRDDER